MPTEIPPELTVDREIEQKEFKTLLNFQDDARLLIIQDIPQTGKSTLLRRLQDNCLFEVIPAGIVDLNKEKNKDLITPLSLVLKTRESLAQLEFKIFDNLNSNRVNKRPSSFMSIDQNFGGASFSGGNQTITGQNFQAQQGAQQTINLPPTNWTDAQEELASQECVKAFLAEIKMLCNQQTVVLMLDHFDFAIQDLQTWILNRLIIPLCFDLPNRPARLMMVLAGHKNPIFDKLLEHPLSSSIIRSKWSLRNWSDADIKKLLKVHEKDGLTEEQMNKLVDMVKSGFPIGHALGMADGFIAMNG